MYTFYSHGLHGNQQLRNLMGSIFDKKLIDHHILFYSPVRAHCKLYIERRSGKDNKIVAIRKEGIAYDSVNMNDGDLMINTGVWANGERHRLFYCGGLNSLLPIL